MSSGSSVIHDQPLGVKPYHQENITYMAIFCDKSEGDAMKSPSMRLPQDNPDTGPGDPE
ncbi:hypothetical protein N8616_02055 [Verrucomicrobia bacterium]|nr:hypothetical protein [Verrucomicrobiota bacterium]MDB4777459.1 hypothetical protein [Verrucomicrobiota bacterium]